VQFHKVDRFVKVRCGRFTPSRSFILTPSYIHQLHFSVRKVGTNLGTCQILGSQCPNANVTETPQLCYPGTAASWLADVICLDRPLRVMSLSGGYM